MYWQVILMQVSIDIIPHEIIRRLHRVVARGISPGSPAWRGSFKTKCVAAWENPPEVAGPRFELRAKILLFFQKCFFLFFYF
jgi:hypothetical protein